MGLKTTPPQEVPEYGEELYAIAWDVGPEECDLATWPCYLVRVVRESATSGG